MIAALLVVSLAMPARDAWSTDYVVDTPREWRVGAGGPVPFRDPPACVPAARQRAERAVTAGDGVVCALASDAQVAPGASPFTLARANAWSRPLDGRVVHLVALPRDRVAVLLERALRVVDARTGVDAAPPLVLPGYPNWAAADGDTLLVRMHAELVAIDTTGGPKGDGALAVLWRHGDDGMGTTLSAPVRCGGRWVDASALREIPDGDFARSKATVTLRAFDTTQGLVGEQRVAVEPRFFNQVSFEPRCEDTGRVRVVARWIILD